MQGPMAVLNVLTIPPGATQTQARLVLDGVRGAVFVYASGGALVGSWAGAAGTDPYGNAYPAGLFTTAGSGTIEGTDFIINNSGAFFYTGAPAFGNLIASIASASGVDQFGNDYVAGFAAYTVGGTFNGSNIQINSNTIQFFNPGDTAPAVLSLATVFGGVDAFQLSSPVINFTDKQAFLALIRDVAGGTALVQILGAALNIKTTTVPAAPANGTDLYVDGAGKLAMIPQAGSAMQVPGASLATFPGTTVTAATLTNLATMTIPANDAEAGSCYEIEVEGNWTEATGTAVSFQFGAAFGGTNLANQTISPTGFNAGGTGRFVARVRVYCLSSGVSATWKTSVWATVTPNANPNNSVTICDDDANTVTTFSSTVNRTLALRFAWGSVTGSPSIVNQMQVNKRVA